MNSYLNWFLGRPTNSARQPGPDISASDNFSVDDHDNTLRRHASENTIFNCSTFWAGNAIISQAIGSTGANVYRTRKSGKVEKATDHELEQVFEDLMENHPVNRMISRAYNDFTVPIQYLGTTQTHLNIRGNAFSYINKNARGQATSLDWLMPDSVQVGINSRNQPVYRVTDQPQISWSSPVSFVPTGTNGTFKTTDQHFDDIFHPKGFSLDNITGLSLLSCASQGINLALLQEDFATTQLIRGRPMGFLKKEAKLQKDQIVDIREEWRVLHERAENYRKIGVLHGGLDWVNMGFDNAALELLAQRKYSAVEMARFLRLPVHLLGELGDAKYADIEQLMIEFILMTLLPWCIQIEQEMNLKFFTYSESFNHHVWFDLDSWMRGDALTRANVNQIEYRASSLTTDEWRNQRHRNPHPNGIGSVPMVMASQMDTLERVVDGTSALQGNKPTPAPDSKVPSKKAKNDAES